MPPVRAAAIAGLGVLAIANTLPEASGSPTDLAMSKMSMLAGVVNGLGSLVNAAGVSTGCSVGGFTTGTAAATTTAGAAIGGASAAAGVVGAAIGGFGYGSWINTVSARLLGNKTFMDWAADIGLGVHDEVVGVVGKGKLGNALGHGLGIATVLGAAVYGTAAAITMGPFVAAGLIAADVVGGFRKSWTEVFG